MLGYLRRVWWGWGFLQSVSYIKLIPTHEKIFCCGKKWPKCHFLTYFFLGWVGLGVAEFVGFVTVNVFQHPSGWSQRLLNGVYISSKRRCYCTTRYVYYSSVIFLLIGVVSFDLIFACWYDTDLIFAYRCGIDLIFRVSVWYRLFFSICLLYTSDAADE